MITGGQRGRRLRKWDWVESVESEWETIVMICHRRVVHYYYHTFIH